ncbi:MAG TPA: tetratricopeptide repeat protein [Gemmatimonadaceae bacterium]|nr:tetratricopeptide repeat protein [Gemmatimonadaceae bacterium]
MTRIIRLFIAATLAVPAPLAAQTPAVTVANVTPASAPPPATLDSAINRLQDFLARYPTSPLRPNALLQLGELLVRQADTVFAESQRAAGVTARPDSGAAARPTPAAPSAAAAATPNGAPIAPDYSAAITRYEELVTRYPNFEQIDAASYTLGTLYASTQRWADAAKMFERVTAMTNSRFRGEAFFRLGDARFELASRQRGDVRRAWFASAATAYEQAVASTQPPGDIYFLALYKLGWSYYNQANQANQAEYQKAVDVFGRLVDAYDKLTKEQQSRLGLRGEAIEYMAVAFTQVGGAQAANRYFQSRGGAPYQLPLMRRVAQTFRDQGNFPEAIQAYQMVLTQSPTDSSVLTATREIADIYQNRLLERDSAQAARLRLAEILAPGGAWAQANPQLADSAAKLREAALRESGQYLLASAQAGNRAGFADAAQTYRRYLTDFPKSDSAQMVNRYLGEALFGAGDYTHAGSEFAKAAYTYGNGNQELAQEAGRNAIISFDSALVRNKTDHAAQDSLFLAVDRFVAAFPQTDVAKKALIEKGRRASETKRWDAMQQAFRTYAATYPNDPYTPTAQRLVGDAMYRSGQYAQAQTQWEQAQTVAISSGQTRLADSIRVLRETAAGSFADSLVKRGQYSEAAEQVYVAYAKANPQNAKAPDALRNAIETYMLADSVARSHNDQSASRQARERAIELSAQLSQQYPNYKYRLQYQTLRARLLADLGKRDEAVQAYQQLIQQNTNWNGRSDAMVRVAVMLDSLGKKKEAAVAYEQFANTYPRDERAADALWNAAVTYAEAPDPAAAARAYAVFAQRYPRDERAGNARQQQIAQLKTSGDTAAANRALSSACSTASDALQTECSSRVADRAFQQGVATFGEYQPLKLTIGYKSQLNAAGVARASRDKQTLLRQLTSDFSQAIKTGVPQYLAASSYYVGLAQWEYGNFLKNVQLPSSLTDAERTAAQQGAAQQAEQYYSAARQVWQELVQRAQSTPAIGNDASARPWIDRARKAVQGNVDATPPSVVTGGR